MPNEPITGTGLLSLAAALQSMPVVNEGKWYNKQKVTLDGYCFRRCRFDGCELSARNATFTLENCIIANCTIVVGEPSAKIIKLFAAAYPPLESVFSAFAEYKNSDGTVTIK